MLTLRLSYSRVVFPLQNGIRNESFLAFLQFQTVSMILKLAKSRLLLTRNGQHYKLRMYLIEVTGFM